MSKANDVQVAGDHYKRAGSHQHWDFAADNQLGYFEGQITKYITRWRKKNGLQDLKKAAHFLDKLYELYTTTGYRSPQLLTYRSTRSVHTIGFSKFSVANELLMDEGRICILLATYREPNELLEVKRLIAGLIEQEQSRLSARTEQRVEEWSNQP